MTRPRKTGTPRAASPAAKEAALAPLLELRIAGTYAAIARARGRLARWLEASGVPRNAVSELALVLTEICSNALEHGTAARDRPLELTARRARHHVRLEIIEGAAAAADPVVEAILSASSPPAATSERGRGFFLVRAYVDTLRIDTDPRGFLRIRIQKRLCP